MGVAESECQCGEKEEVETRGLYCPNCGKRISATSKERDREKKEKKESKDSHRKESGAGWSFGQTFALGAMALVAGTLVTTAATTNHKSTNNRYGNSDDDEME
eukprot:CAMPEP_0202695362 /NCGR_PEP_ID=MMETSP1385-20130828/8972_1 /ASSEMBLY_ACC=CAM_ASM_000861 /TAXON_ID=933848 /ORGANISM="Elphidium margaritaceum" /LENGTH=102 /DNA_ID=CAMNT_0049351371 /DNA_START=59 /DNA_END=367 /DNA_ORIENTATION=+